MNVVHPDHLAQHLESVQVVHGQDRAPLVLVAQKSKPLNRARDERDVCVRCFFAAIWMGKNTFKLPPLKGFSCTASGLYFTIYTNSEADQKPLGSATLFCLRRKGTFSLPVPYLSYLQDSSISLV